jgi:hypothetical protein
LVEFHRIYIKKRGLLFVEGCLSYFILLVALVLLLKSFNANKSPRIGAALAQL